jgi:hypothetical protein
MPHMENPAGQGGAPGVSLAAGKIDPESNRPILNQQAGVLTRRCAISMGLALALAPMIYGEGAQ